MRKRRRTANKTTNNTQTYTHTGADRKISHKSEFHSGYVRSTHTQHISDEHKLDFAFAKCAHSLLIFPSFIFIISSDFVSRCADSIWLSVRARRASLSYPGACDIVRGIRAIKNGWCEPAKLISLTWCRCCSWQMPVSVDTHSLARRLSHSCAHVMVFVFSAQFWFIRVFVTRNK